MNEPESASESSEQETTGRTVVGMFSRRDHAEAAIRELKTAGFTDDQIGVATQESGAGVLITVDAGPRTPEALGILERHGMDPGPGRASRALPTERDATGDAAAAGTVGTAGAAAATLHGPGVEIPAIGDTDVASGSSVGDLDVGRRSPWEGLERRTRRSAAYHGAERRAAPG